MPPDGLTIDEAAQWLDPPMPRRTLSQLLASVPPIGRRYGKRGPRPAVYPVDAIALAHADWLERQG